MITQQSKNESVSHSSMSNQRIAHLDLLRGVAVLGLLFMNIPYMGMFELGYVMHEPMLLVDQVMAVTNAFLFDGRFRSLFCILFAIGLFLQFQKYKPMGFDPSMILKSRLSWLLLFGVIHCTFIWPGDILIMYALSGFVLLSRLDHTSTQLLKNGMILFSIGIVIFLIEMGLIVYFDTPMVRGSDAYQEAISSIPTTYVDRLYSNFIIAVAYIVSFPLLSMCYLVGTMFIGLGLYKQGDLTTGFSSSALSTLLLITLMISSIDAYIAVQYPFIWNSSNGIGGAISGLTMALLIWHLVVTNKLAEAKTWFVGAVKSVGKMAFTMYIFQSVVMTIIFRELFFEWALSFTLLDYFLTSLGFALVQLLFASLYLSFFKQGPLEFIWRLAVQRRLDELQRDVSRVAKQRSSEINKQLN